MELAPVSIDVSSSVSREPLEEVREQEGEFLSVVDRIEARNLPVDFDIHLWSGGPVIPFRDLQANSIEGVRVPAEDVFISTNGTSGTTLELLLEGSR